MASFWEKTGCRLGLKADSGFLLGGDAPGIVDIVTATLWSNLADRFDIIEAILKGTAPMTMALTRRIVEMPQMPGSPQKAGEKYGDVYCGGEIEASLRKALAA
jgi:glutathione S-transferase